MYSDPIEKSCGFPIRGFLRHLETHARPFPCRVHGNSLALSARYTKTSETFGLWNLLVVEPSSFDLVFMGDLPTPLTDVGSPHTLYCFRPRHRPYLLVGLAPTHAFGKSTHEPFKDYVPTTLSDSHRIKTTSGDTRICTVGYASLKQYTDLHRWVC